MRRQKGREMLGHADGPHTRAATTVRNGKRFVQVEVAYIRADIAGAGEAYLRIHIRTIHIHLTPIGVNDPGNLANAFLVHTVGAGVGHHQAGKITLVCFCFFTQIGYVNVALLVAFHQHNFHAAHRGGSGVSAMRRSRYQRDIAMRIATRTVVGLDHHQPRILALRAAVGLKTHLGEAGNFTQRVIQIGDDFLKTCNLIEWYKGMNVGKLRPGNRQQLGCGIELHGAGAQRNHRVR